MEKYIKNKNDICNEVEYFFVVRFSVLPFWYTYFLEN